MASIVWTQNTTAQVLQCNCVTPAGSVLSLTNATGVTMKMRPDTANTVYSVLTGTGTITNASGGIFTYQFAAADVAQAGDYQLVAEIQFTGGLILNLLPVPFSIQQAV